MKLFWGFIIGVGILLLAEVPFGISILIVGAICLIVFLVGSLANVNAKGTNTPTTPTHNDRMYLSQRQTEVKSQESSIYVTDNNSNNKDISAVLSDIKTSLDNLGLHISIGVDDIKLESHNADANDDSVIDVTGQNYELNITQKQELQDPSMPNIPYWGHSYIYSTSHLKYYASEDVRRFYSKYKAAFLRGEYYNLRGNTNYAFTLMFDLFESDKEYAFAQLVLLIPALIEHYPETRTYAIDNLVQRAKSLSSSESLKHASIIVSLQEQYPDCRHWTFSDKYAKKFNFAPEEMEIFNYIYNKQDYYYYTLDFMFLKSLQLFRDVIKRLSQDYRKEGKELSVEFKRVAGMMTRRPYYRFGESDKNPIKERVWELYNCIWILCNNQLHEKYDYGYSKADVFYSVGDDNRKILVANLMPRVQLALQDVLSLYPEVLTDEEEIIVNQHHGTRWRPRFQAIIAGYTGQIDDFVNQVYHLAKLNGQNYGVGYLLFDAAKFLVDKDNIAALKMYLRYVEAYRKFSDDAEKPLPKYICKKLFKKIEQQGEFEDVVRQYKNDDDREKAYGVIDKLFLPKRKKLHLDKEEITKISEQHSETVQLLNDVMDEGEIIDINSHRETVFEIANNNSQTNSLLDSYHLELLGIFVHHNLYLPKSRVEEYAKANGLLANRLIDKINELCYDILDDVLIEDNGENWTITEDYLKKIVA